MMAQTTSKYNLVKPDVNDFYDINILNNNMDVIDEELEKKASVINGKIVPMPTAADVMAMASNLPKVPSKSNLIDWVNSKDVSGVFRIENDITNGVPYAAFWIGVLFKDALGKSLMIFDSNVNKGRVYTSCSTSAGWTDWKYFSTDSDLAKKQNVYGKILSNDGMPQTWEDVWALSPGTYEWVQTTPLTWQPSNTPNGALRVNLELLSCEATAFGIMRYLDGATNLRAYIIEMPNRCSMIYDEHNIKISTAAPVNALPDGFMHMVY